MVWIREGDPFSGFISLFKHNFLGGGSSLSLMVLSIWVPCGTIFANFYFWTNSRPTKELNREHIFSLAFYQPSSDISIAYNQRIKTKN